MTTSAIGARMIAVPADPPFDPAASTVPAEEWSPVQQTPPVPVPDPGQEPDGPDAPPPTPPWLPGDGPSQGPGGQLPPGPPPNVPPPGTPPVPTKPPSDPGPVEPPTGPDPTDPDPTDPGPTDPPPSDDPGLDWKPWLVGAGAVGAGVLGVLAVRSGIRNVRALNAAGAAFESGAMHQGGLQAIQDAGLGARFANGIGVGDRALVATPIVNRIGTGGRLASVARGQLDHAELLAASTALRRTTGDGVAVFEPMRRQVLQELEGGRALPSVLDDLDRSAAGAKPAFDNAQLARYWDRTSIVERGAKVGGSHVPSGVDATRARLALRDGEIVEAGGQVRINQLVAGRGADLDGKGLADGIGAIQGVGVSRLNPEMQRAAIEASGVDPQLVDSLGLNGAFAARWKDRLAHA